MALHTFMGTHTHTHTQRLASLVRARAARWLLKFGRQVGEISAHLLPLATTQSGLEGGSCHNGAAKPLCSSSDSALRFSNAKLRERERAGRFCRAI